MAAPNKFVSERAHNVWMASQSKSFVARLLRVLGAARPADIIYIEEYNTGDWNMAHCIENPVRVWAYKGDEFEEIEAVDKLDKTNAIASRTPVIRYCLDENGQRMIYTVWYGIRAGNGHIMKRVGEDWKSEGRSWIS